MKKRKPRPAKGAAENLKSACIVSLKPLSAYEKRALEALVEGETDRRLLDSKIGTTNAPEYVRKLRERGLSIKTETIRGLNRDQRPSWWGRYSLHPDSKLKAYELLKRGSA